jgi:hypothetical protein
MHPSLVMANHLYQSTRDELLLPSISPFFSLLVAFIAFLLGTSLWLTCSLGLVALIMIGIYNEIMHSLHMDEYRLRYYAYLDTTNLRRSPRLAERKIEELPNYRD